MKKILLLSFLMIVVNSVQAQPDLIWVKNIGGTGYDGAYAMTADDNENIYITGYFSNIVDFNTGVGVENLVSKGGTDVFVAKYDKNGQFLWAKSFGGTGFDLGVNIALDNSNNVYVTGFFLNSVDFDPGIGINNITSLGQKDMFISKFTSNGSYEWTKRIGGSRSIDPRSIVIDDNDNIYTTGYFEGTIDFDPNIGIQNLIATVGTDVFVSKFDAMGNYIWAKQLGGTSHEDGFSIAIDNAGNVLLTGTYRETMDFDPNIGVYNMSGTGILATPYCLKLDPNGDFLWAVQFKGSNHSLATGLATDNVGNVYLAGKFQYTTDFNPGAPVSNLSSSGNYDGYLCKLNSNGQFDWVFKIGDFKEDYISSVFVDDSNYIYIIGDQYSPNVDYDPHSGIHNLSNTGLEANFIAKYDQNANLICSYIITPGHNETESDHHIFVKGSNIYIANAYNDASVDFDPCDGTTNLTLNGDYDIGLIKYNMSNCICDFLAVHLDELKVQCESSNRKLSWKNYSEVSYFLVQKSKDGKNWETLSKIGNTGDGGSLFVYDDLEDLHEKAYYRLEILEKGGDMFYSEIVSTMCDNEMEVVKELFVFPNPVTDDMVNIQVINPSKSEIEIKLIGGNGNEITSSTFQMENESMNYQIDLSKYSRGEYFVEVLIENEKLTEKIIKN